MKMRTMWRAPLAVAYWLGAIGNKAFHAGGDTVFLCHGTPQRSAGRLELQLRFLRRSFAIVARQHQSLRAGVVLESGAKFGERDLQKLCHARLEAFMVPKHIVAVPSLPKTDTGKIRKLALS